MIFKAVVKNTLTQLVGRLLSAAISLCATFLLARALGPSYFGEYTKIITLVVLFYFIVDLGLNAIFLKDLENAPAQKASLLNKLIALRLILSVVASFGIILLAGLVWYFTHTFSPLVVFGVIIGSISIFGYGIFLSISGFFQHKLDFKSNVAASLLGSLAWLVCIFFASIIFVDNPFYLVLVVMIGFVIGTFVTVVCGLLRLNNFMQIKIFLFSPVFAKKIIQESIPLAAVLLINLIYFRVDIWVLSYFRASSEIGAYALAYRFFDFAIALPVLAINSLYPMLLKKTEATEKSTYWLIGLAFMVVAICIVGVFWLFAPLLVLIREDYIEAVAYLKILALSIPLFYLTAPIMWYFILRQKQKQLLIIYIPALIFNMVANLWAVPYYGAYASAVITGVGELVILLLGVCLLVKKPKL